MDLETTLKSFEQEHLLKFYDNLDEDQQNTFTNELRGVNFKLMAKLFGRAKDELEKPAVRIDELMEQVPAEIVAEKKTASAEQNQEWWNAGLKEISDGSVAVILLAGGQGTRLGFNHPKGMYNVGLPSNKTLYQLQAERILKAQQLATAKYGKECRIRWYIMVSEATLKDSKDFFESHSYFGLDGSNVVFFEQHQLPCLTFEGKLILANQGALAKAPDGNGGLYTALKSANIIGDMEAHDVKHTFVYCVDNILVKVADPSFIGYCAMKEVDAANKVIEKIDPNEGVGVVCLVEQKYKVVEYSEISQEISSKRREDGRLLFNDSNICLHYFSTSFLSKLVTEHLEEMPHHIAKKKIPHVNDKGELVKPTAPNGMKLEKFVFDVFQFTDKFALFLCLREEEFSPLKNAPDTPKASPISCRQDICALHRRYLTDAGAVFVNSDGDVVEDNTTACEISPLLSYAGEGLESYKGYKFPVGEPICLNEASTVSPRSKKAKN